ncbi:hypothetical protein JG626_18980, partial [Vibrio cholerae]|nr:hypothetical protein [Vibrio cholerae]
MLSRIKEESLLVVHLTQREQMMMNEQKDLTLRLERAERSAKEYEMELEEWITRARGP